MTTRHFRQAMTAALLMALGACGGGGGADGGIGGTGGGGGGSVGGSEVSYGTITAFGSVWVNGVEFSSSGATIKLDGVSVFESSLRVGMVVRVDGSITNKTASAITVDDAIKGRVEQAPTANTLRVMGQTVQFDSLTPFGNNVVPALGDLVEVHGLVAGDGVISASFIEKKTTPANPPFAVKGLVKAHDTAALSFQVGTLIVRYAGALATDMPAGSWNGLQVDVKGTACTGSPVCGTLTATKVEPAGAAVASAPKAEIEGIVSAVSGANFSIGNQAVVTSAATRYEGGVAADVVLGAKVEAEGAIAGGVLTATKVSFRDAVRLEGDVATVASATGNPGTVTLTGLPGVSVNVNALTQFKGGITSLTGVSAPNHIRVRGRAGSGGVMIASEFELRSVSADPRVELQAAVSAFDAATTSLTLQGVVVNTAAVTTFRDASGAATTSAAFYAALKVGSVVKVRGSRSGNNVIWDQAELES